MRRTLLTVIVAAALTSPTAALAQTPQTSLPDIEDEVMCPICGVTLELAIDAPQAQQEREFIRGLIAEGLTKDEIKDRLVAEFGPEVLSIPEAEGFDLAAWLVPAVAILAAAAAIFVGLRRWRRDGDDGPDRPPGVDDLTPEDRERLESDLARYEL